MERINASQPAPYGHACMHCFKSKCKCVKGPNGDRCERCHRLNKQCVPSDSLRRRHGQRNQDSPARIAELEGKLDRIVGLLQSVAQSTNSSGALRKVFDDDADLAGRGQPQTQQLDHANPDPMAISSSSSGGVTTDTGGLPGPGVSPTATSPLTSDQPSEARGSPSSRLHSSQVSTKEADDCLTLFRSKFLRYVPFFHLPPGLTAKGLSRDRPFLFRAIVAVTATSTQQKLARGRELKRILAHTTLLENQSSIDLLLGLLTYIAWGNDQFLNKVGSLSRLMQMAMSLVYDLRLNKPLSQDCHMVSSLSLQSTCLGTGGDEADQHSFEQQRAVLGCFLLSSFVSSYFAQIDPMRWTPQMEQYLRNLDNSAECPTDRMFALQIRLQLLAQNVVHIRDKHELLCSQAAGLSVPLPQSMYFKTAQTQLRTLLATIPPELQQQEILKAHVQYVELSIHETFYPSNMGFSSRQASTESTAAPNKSGYGVPSFDGLDSFWQSLGAIKAWLDVFFTLSETPSACVGFSFVFWAQLARCLVVLYRLSTLADHSGIWDLRAVRGVADLMPVLERVAGSMDKTSIEAGELSGDDLFAQIARLMRTFGLWARTKIPAAMTVEDGIAQEGQGEQPFHAWNFDAAVQAAPIENPLLGNQMDIAIMQSIDLGNDLWLEDFFGHS